jgi:hypothetical protein
MEPLKSITFGFGPLQATAPVIDITANQHDVKPKCAHCGRETYMERLFDVQQHIDYENERIYEIYQCEGCTNFTALTYLPNVIDFGT